MIAASDLKKNALPLLLLLLLLVSGCGIASTYQPAGKKTIRDFTGSGDYRKKVGVMALANTTRFASEQVASPFMTTFLASMESGAADAVLVVPGKADVPPFLWDPPRLANGDLDVFSLSQPWPGRRV